MPDLVIELSQRDLPFPKPRESAARDRILALATRDLFSPGFVTMVDIGIVVTDARRPLISLAAAQSLDYLLYPALPLIIPDAVFHEATASAGKLGAQEILDWYRANLTAVRIEPTAIFLDEITLREGDGRRLSRDLGERAALEVGRATLPALRR